MKVKEKMIGGVAMTQNLTYTRCGDYGRIQLYPKLG